MQSIDLSFNSYKGFIEIEIVELIEIDLYSFNSYKGFIEIKSIIKL